MSIAREALAHVLEIDEDSIPGDEADLFETFPDIDSLAIANLITTVENLSGKKIQYDQVDPDDLETIGSFDNWVQGIVNE